MKVFEDFEYKRPDVEKVKKDINGKVSALKGAKNSKEFFNYIEETEKLRADIDSMIVLADIRFRQNTKDEFYLREHEYCDGLTAVMQELSRGYFEVIINSKFKVDFEKKYGKNVISIMELTLRTIKSEVVSLIGEENKLKSEYTKLLSSAMFDYDGKKITKGELQALFFSKDRGVRKRAQELFSDFFKEHEGEFDQLFDKLVKLRHKIALSLGYSNFLKLGYDRWGKVDYGINNIKNLHRNILEIFLPLVRKMRCWQREDIGVDKLYYYDDKFYFKNEVDLIVDSSSVINEVKKTFEEMGKESRTFFDYMIKRGLLDLLPRKNKLDWGFCQFVKKEKAPFIFMGYSGAADDLVTLFHESGHALSCFRNRDKHFDEWNFVGLELAEVHSSTMEFFTWPWAERFTTRPDLFKMSTLFHAVYFIPYGLLVDAFQHWVYENPSASIEDRKKKWREMEMVYLPEKDYEDNSFLNRGNFWLRQMHIFELPLYYIDYVIAYLCSFQYLIKSREDFKSAWKEYINLIDSAINHGFNDILKIGNLKSPFNRETIIELTNKLDELLDELTKKV